MENKKNGNMKRKDIGNLRNQSETVESCGTWMGEVMTSEGRANSDSRELDWREIKHIGGDLGDLKGRNCSIKTLFCPL